MKRTSAPTPWLVCHKPNPQALLRLFCFPYAGGSARIYHAWHQRLPTNVEVCSVELPGRGHRLRENPFTRLLLLAQSSADALLPHLDKPFAFFGHSMGATLSFEVSRLLRRELDIEPIHLFVSGRRAPQIPETRPPTYALPEAEFLEKLRSLNGIPKEVLEHGELMQLILPVLRADFEAVQTYEFTAGLPLGCPITAFGGLQDKAVTRLDLERWQEQTTADFALRMLPGDHFFLRTAELLLLEKIAHVVSGFSVQ